MEPAKFSSLYNFDFDDSLLMKTNAVLEEVLAVEAAEYIPSPEDLIKDGNYEAAARSYLSQAASPDKDSLFKKMADFLFAHPDYLRTWPILFDLVETNQKHAFMLNAADGLLNEKKCAFAAAQKKVEELVAKADGTRKQQREEINKRKVEAIDACSTIPALSHVRQIVKIRVREWHDANEKLLQTTYSLFIETIKNLPQVHEPSARRDSVTQVFMHPALQQVRQFVAAKKQELDEAIRMLFQGAVHLQIPQVCEILRDIEAKEQLLRTRDPAIEQAALVLHQKREELGAAYEKVRYIHQLLENPSWQKALEVKMLANLIDMEQRSQFASWLNRPG